MGSYSVDIMKKVSFEDELQNVINLLPQGDGLKPVVEYLNKRINELSDEHDDEDER